MVEEDKRKIGIEYASNLASAERWLGSLFDFNRGVIEIEPESLRIDNEFLDLRVKVNGRSEYIASPLRDVNNVFYVGRTVGELLHNAARPDLEERKMGALKEYSSGNFGSFYFKQLVNFDIEGMQLSGTINANFQFFCEEARAIHNLQSVVMDCSGWAYGSAMEGLGEDPIQRSASRVEEISLKKLDGDISRKEEFFLRFSNYQLASLGISKALYASEGYRIISSIVPLSVEDAIKRIKSITGVDISGDIVDQTI